MSGQEKSRNVKNNDGIQFVEMSRIKLPHSCKLKFEVCSNGRDRMLGQSLPQLDLRDQKSRLYSLFFLKCIMKEKCLPHFFPSYSSNRWAQAHKIYIIRLDLSQGDRAQYVLCKCHQNSLF